MFGCMNTLWLLMKSGRKEGLWMEWYDNGTKKTQINHSNGKMFGSFIFFDEKKPLKVLE